MLSFLNQALFGGDDDARNHRNSSLDNGQQQPAWRDLTTFYQEHEQTIKKYESLDLLWFAKHDKNSELEEAIEGFASSANVIAEGLVRLANVHPILGGACSLLAGIVEGTPRLTFAFTVAVSAYHSVLTILLPSAAGHKKVLLVMLQMQVMMSAMFQYVVDFCLYIPRIQSQLILGYDISNTQFEQRLGRRKPRCRISSFPLRRILCNTGMIWTSL